MYQCLVIPDDVWLHVHIIESIDYVLEIITLYTYHLGNCHINISFIQLFIASVKWKEQ